MALKPFLDTIDLLEHESSINTFPYSENMNKDWSRGWTGGKRCQKQEKSSKQCHNESWCICAVICNWIRVFETLKNRTDSYECECIVQWWCPVDDRVDQYVLLESVSYHLALRQFCDRKSMEVLLTQMASFNFLSTVHHIFHFLTSLRIHALHVSWCRYSEEILPVQRACPLSNICDIWEQDSK